MTHEIDKQNLTSYWIKKNVPDHVIQTLINHLKSFKFMIIDALIFTIILNIIKKFIQERA